MEHYLDSTQTDCTVCCRKSLLFQWLKDDELDIIKKNKHTIRYNRGETIRKQGTSMTHVISLNSGLAKLYLEGVDQQNSILKIEKATHFIGGPGIYLDQIHHFSVTALTDTIVCFIELGTFKDVLALNRRFAEEFMKDFSRNSLFVYNRLISLTQKQIPGRMADALLYLSESIFENDVFEMMLSRQELAELSAMSKDSSVKILRQFQEEGIIRITASSLEILNKEALIRMSKTG